MMEQQIKLEELYAKFNLKDTLRKELAALELDEFNTELQLQLLIHRQALPSTLIGAMRWIDKDIQSIADRIQEAISIGQVGWDGQHCHTLLSLDPELEKSLALFQFPLPSLVQPKKLKTNKDSGYYTKDTGAMLRNFPKEEDINLDHLNRVNDVPLSINVEVFQTAQNQWKNIITSEQRKQFLKFNTETKEIMEFFIGANNKFYLTHKYDKRGRYYCVGYHINYQGNDYQKALIQFHNKEML